MEATVDASQTRWLPVHSIIAITKIQFFGNSAVSRNTRRSIGARDFGRLFRRSYETAAARNSKTFRPVRNIRNPSIHVRHNIVWRHCPAIGWRKCVITLSKMIGNTMLKSRGRHSSDFGTLGVYDWWKAAISSAARLVMSRRRPVIHRQTSCSVLINQTLGSIIIMFVYNAGKEYIQNIDDCIGWPKNGTLSVRLNNFKY